MELFQMEPIEEWMPTEDLQPEHNKCLTEYSQIIFTLKIMKLFTTMKKGGESLSKFSTNESAYTYFTGMMF